MIPARQARCAGLSGCNPSHRCLPSPRVTLLAMPALCRLLSEGGISARIELPGREPWAGTCERRSVEQRRNGVSVGKLRLWGGSGFAVGWGWGEEEGMGKAREVFSRKESSWEKKIPHLGSYWLLGVLFRKQRIRKRTQHIASRVLQNIRPFSLSFFFFPGGGWASHHCPVHSSEKGKMGCALQMVRLSDQDRMCVFHPKSLVAQLGVISTGSWSNSGLEILPRVTLFSLFVSPVIK